MSEYFVLNGKKFVPEIQSNSVYHIAWDDENIDYDKKCRTQQPWWGFGISAPPAVVRYYPTMKEKAGEFWADYTNWKQAFLDLNDGDIRKFNYWTTETAGQFNKGYPKFMNVGMSGNIINGEVIGDWYRFETLKESDFNKVKGMTRFTHPHLVHTFTCVGWDAKTKTTKHIWSTNTGRGVIDYFLVTKEGYAYIPLRHAIKS